MQDLLQANKEAAFQGKTLVTIVKDVPITLDLDKCKLQTYDRDARSHIIPGARIQRDVVPAAPIPYPAKLSLSMNTPATMVNTIQ